jgi:dienelactone hydrolase
MVPAALQRRRRLWRAALATTVLGVVALLIAYAPSFVRAAVVLSASVDMYEGGFATRLVSYDVSVADAPLALPGRALRSRRYAPRDRARPPVTLLLHGVHPRGIDEPRLRQFARALASVGLEVHTPELPELAAFEAQPRLIADIANCAAALQQRSHGRRVGAFGISFAGGLLLVAAAMPRGDTAFAYVVALGAHHDMRRLARYYAGRGLSSRDGTRSAPPPHRYAGRILASAYAADLFSAEDAPIARQAWTLQLAERYRDAAAARDRLSEQGQQRLRDVLEGPSPALQGLLVHAADRRAAALASLSPAGRLGRLRVPVFLLHGVDDPIVPSSESEWLADEVPEAALQRVLLTPALRHAEGSGAPELRESVRLVAFVAAVLRRAER